MKSLKTLVIGLLAVVATACGDSGRFSVQGTVEGGKSMNLRYVFYNGNAFAQGITAVRDGRFSFEGVTMQPAMMELYDNDYRLLGRLYVANGDEIECTIDPSDPYMLRASGNDALARWTRWQRDNAPALNAGRADALVEKYVGEHAADVVSTLLLTSLYDASTPDGLRRADSLLSLIEPDARPMNLTQSFMAQIDANLHADTLRVRDFKARVLGKGPDTVRVADAPLSVYALSTEHSLRKDSVVPLLTELHKRSGRRSVRVVDISLDADTTAWRRITRPDSADWTQAWLPGGTAARGIDSLAVPSLPYFIVADSTGRQLLRTPSAGAVRHYIESAE
ncbi:MAG: DUF4369 domain-containing protein [Muribaculaceae bacterium]|nr:DUF4369 domain-containing protein [Muribaculaceae bacterium]